VPTVGRRAEEEEEGEREEAIVAYEEGFDADAIDGTAIATFKQGAR
jgi:hypothetical protein